MSVHRDFENLLKLATDAQAHADALRARFAAVDPEQRAASAAAFAYAIEATEAVVRKALRLMAEIAQYCPDVVERLAAAGKLTLHPTGWGESENRTIH